jgi:N-acetylneuraminate synthase
VADNHSGNVQTAKRLIDAAKEAGADVVKFQIHLPDVEMVPGSIQMWDGPLYDILKRNLLSPEQHKELIDYCQKVGITYLCTPFCMDASDILEKLGVTAFKTGSGEMTNLPMIRHIAKKGKPMIVSTGMCSLDEIDETVNTLKKENVAFALTNCTSEYPPQYENINLPLIKIMQERYGVPVGHSDHSPDIATALAAVAMGAKIVEKHFTLDKNQKGPDHFISLEPRGLAELVDGIRKIEKAMQSKPKTVTPNEKVVRAWAHHSVVAATDVPAGTVLKKEMLTVKRPGSGIPAKHWDELVGKKTKRAFKKNDILQWSDVDK